MVYNIDGFDFDRLHFSPAPRSAGETGKHYYADCVCAFDIETSTIEVDGEPQAFMYIWQFAIDRTVIVGRTWGDFKALLYQLRHRLGGLRLMVFVHNLSFEMQFLAGIYHFNDYEVFCTDSRKVLKCSMYNTFEFRCSYKMTNLGLDALTARYDVEHKKRSGVSFDYHKIRYAETPLNHKEMMYAVYDVLGLVEAVRAIMALNDDDLYTLPLTSTGFVRRNVKRAMRDYHAEMLAVWPPYRVYQLLKSAFRGGNTHANRFYSGEILEDVHSMDISSSYPSQQCNKLFPVSDWKECHTNTVSYLEKCMNTEQAVIMHVALYDVELRDRYAPVPYIPIAKCMHISYPVGDSRGLCTDNGRILRAAYLEMCITDIDYRIICNMYKIGKMEILEMYRSNYGFLPWPIIEQNMEYFWRKTELKGIKGQELYYHKNKELLNSIYGMSVQDPVKENILFADLGYTLDESKSREDIYNRRKNVAFTQYAYGVWTTARARESLQAGIDLCGDNLVYVDTDSCKYLGEVDFTDYNNARIAECMQSGTWAVDKYGNTHYMGVYEHDDDYKRFITLGAKKYAYEDLDGNVHITVSGVSKKKGAKELSEKGGLESFKPGFVFTGSGKTESIYHDENTRRYVERDGNGIVITRNVVIRETTYTLAVTDDYAELLDSTSAILNKVHKHWRNLQML